MHRVSCRFLVVLWSLCVAIRAVAAELPAAYEPLLSESRQRVAAAQQAIVDWRAKRDALLKQQRAVEKQMRTLAEKLGLLGHEPFKSLEDRISAADKRNRETRERLKTLRPEAFTKASQFAEYDALRAALSPELDTADRERRELIRQFAKRDENGSELAKKWESLEVEIVAADNEAALVQFRRDSIVRREAGLLGKIERRTKEEVPTDVARVPLSQPADAVQRRAQFARRRTPEAIRELGEQFFLQMTLSLPGLETVQKQVEAKNYSAALESYKLYFFKQLLSEGAAIEETESSGDDEGGETAFTRADTVFPPPTADEIRDALAGVVSTTFAEKGSKRRIEASLGEPGAMQWVFAGDGAAVEDVDAGVLDLCRRQGYPGMTAAALWHSYAIGGPQDHLRRWADVLDDWTMNWRRDVERSPLPIRDYNLLYVCRIEETRERLKNVAKMRPSFVKDLPADTFARWLMALNEEYLSAAIRLGRSGLYNFRIMALNSMVPTSLKMREFHAHQWALREGWRQIDNNFIYKIRQDGANHEFANDGHENTDQSLIRPFRLLLTWQREEARRTGTDSQGVAWLEPFWDNEFLDNLLSNTRYWVHNMKPDGASYRLNARSQRTRYLGANPEYKINLLADEDEVRRRVWHVHHIGKPEVPPRVHSEGMAFQGYYYLRSGWQPSDRFVYFQSINQPIMSGREDSTGFSLYGWKGPQLLAPASVVDGKTQNSHYGIVQNPGGKTHFATYGFPNVVKSGRFLGGNQTSSSIDLVEGSFSGVYQFHRPDVFFDVFGSYGYEASLSKAQARAAKEGRPFSDEPIRDVTQSRRIISVAGHYIVTDHLTSDLEHEFKQHYTVYTPVPLDHLGSRLKLLREEKLEPLQVDEKARTLRTHNIGQPNLELRHISAAPLRYDVAPDRQIPAALEANGDPKSLNKLFSKRDKHHTEATQAAQFSRQVAVKWNGKGSQLLLTIVSPRGPHFDTEAPIPALRDVRVIADRADLVGFTAEFGFGNRLAYLTGTTPRELQLKDVLNQALVAQASCLLLQRNPKGKLAGQGLALDCSRIALGDRVLVPPTQDFTFLVVDGEVRLDKPIYRPIQPVQISPSDRNVFVNETEIAFSCPTPDVNFHYTLDGTRPTPQSPKYTGPVKIADTCRVKVRAFRPEVKEDVWQQDGTHATTVFSAVFRKEPLSESVAAKPFSPGLKYEAFHGLWTEVMSRSASLPATRNGTLPSLFDSRVITELQKPGSAFGLRCAGYLNIPTDGVYTLHAPREFLFPDNDCGYDLQLSLANQAWNPAIRWHAHGTWSVALKKGHHPFVVTFADLRLRPHKVELMWGFPHPDFTWKGPAPVIEISGPNLPRQPIPASMLSH